jgi:hypothetical protein
VRLSKNKHHGVAKVAIAHKLAVRLYWMLRSGQSADATFSAQASPLNGVKTLAQYTDWMKGMLGLFPDARYELKSFAIDEGRKSVVAYAVFHATHTGQGDRFRRPVDA